MLPNALVRWWWRQGVRFANQINNSLGFPGIFEEHLSKVEKLQMRCYSGSKIWQRWSRNQPLKYYPQHV
jgi:hypothetical protein